MNINDKNSVSQEALFTIFLSDLVKYYKVDLKKAIELGTRSSGRKPDLPGSLTCSAVSNMSFEDIWELSERTTQDEIFKFYKDQGSWSSFRQVVRHLDLLPFHVHVINYMNIQPQMHVVEYGCGVAPFSRTLLEGLHQENSDLMITLTDVDCEHLEFGEWRLKNVSKNKNLGVKINKRHVKPNLLPKYDKKIDRVIIFEVLEHVPSPVKCIENLYSQMNPGCLVVENFIKHTGDDDDGPDLPSARSERDKYYDFLRDNFVIEKGTTQDENPNETRIWRKK